jgi:alpha-L-fucosidase
MSTPQQDLATPSPQQLKFHKWEVGMFIHFAPNTWQDKEGDDLSIKPKDLNPKKLDTDQWVAVAKSMGAKYIVFVAKHVGGFCWWQTETTDYSVKNTPWKGGQGDVMADLAKSCKKAGIALGVYLSPRDDYFKIVTGGKAKTPEAQADYEAKFRIQLTELLTKYGDIEEVWFDGSLVFGVKDILDKHAPNAVVFQGPEASIRWVGNEHGFAPDPAWNTVKFGAKKWGNFTAADGDPNGDRWLPNECDARIRNTWFWRTDNLETLKSVDDLMEMYELSVGRSSTLLLNNTPDPSGLIPEPDAKRSAEFGAEIKRRYKYPVIDTAGTGTELNMGPSSPVTIDAAMIQEDIRKGERIREYTVEGLVDGEWKVLSKGTAIGYKKIDRFPAVEVSQIRLIVSKSAANPIISKFAVFNTGAK